MFSCIVAFSTRHQNGHNKGTTDNNTVTTYQTSSQQFPALCCLLQWWDLIGQNKVNVCSLLNARVTIFWKAKIGTLDDEFSRDEIYGPSNVLFVKSGTVRCSCRLDCRGSGRDLWPKTKIAVISKKKKKKRRSSPVSSTFCTIFRPKSGKILQPSRRGPFFFFFFFFGDHPNFRRYFQICTLASTIKLATASHRPAFVGELIEMSKNVVKTVAFHWSKKRDLRSKKRDVW